MTEADTSEAEAPRTETDALSLITGWRIVWFTGVILFAWWTASIYHGHQKLIYFSPQSLTYSKQTRITLLGTSIPLYTSEREPDFSRPYLSDYLVEQGYWTPSQDPPTWWLIYDQGHPERRSWIHREFAGEFHFWVGWSGSFRLSRDAWPELLDEMRKASNPLDERMFEPLDKIRREHRRDGWSTFEESDFLTDIWRSYRKAHPLPP